MKKNQTKVFIAVLESVEDCDILGVDLSLDDAWKRIDRSERYHDKNYQFFEESGTVWCGVIECPIGSPFDFEHGFKFEPRKGYKFHRRKKSK